MCTVTLCREAAEVRLTMNRDERWDRAAERPPRVHPATPSGPAWLAPIDGERGGAWIGVNELAVAGCILNGYVAEDLELLDRPEVPSRGELIPALLRCDPTSVWEWLEALDPTRYPSFTLVVATPAEARELRWRRDGQHHLRRLPTGWSMISSSFWRRDEVLAWRHEQFDAWRSAGAPEAGGLPTFHRLAPPERREWAPFMTRPMSATRSITAVRTDLGAGEAHLGWWPRRGDGVADAPEVELSLPLTAESP